MDPEPVIVRRRSSKPYILRRDSCPKHDGSGLLRCSQECKGCAWEEEMIRKLGPPPPIHRSLEEGNYGPTVIPGFIAKGRSES